MAASDADHAERLFALSQDLLGAADAAGRLRWVNDAWERAMGWPLQELYERPYLDFIHPDDRAKVAAFADALAHMPPGESLQVETRARRRDGVYRWLRCSAAVAGGPEPMVYLSGTDVTDLHEALEQLAHRRSELERSNAELDRFAGVVSHDLRSSLTAVTGFLMLLERRHGHELDEDGRALLASAGEASARMHSLVEDLLAYARVGHESPPAREPEPVDVGAVARRIAATVAPHASFEAVGLPVVRALPHQLEQLLTNLIGNAAKFVAPGVRPEIRLTCARDDTVWRFELADNGIGIEPRYTERVFGMFQRLHGGDAYPGTGIGLAIAAKIVEGAGGRISVRAGDHGGSVFAFTWPD